MILRVQNYFSTIIACALETFGVPEFFTTVVLQNRRFLKSSYTRAIYTSVRQRRRIDVTIIGVNPGRSWGMFFHFALVLCRKFISSQAVRSLPKLMAKNRGLPVSLRKHPGGVTTGSNMYAPSAYY